MVHMPLSMSGESFTHVEMIICRPKSPTRRLLHHSQPAVDRESGWRITSTNLEIKTIDSHHSEKLPISNERRYNTCGQELEQVSTTCSEHLGLLAFIGDQPRRGKAGTDGVWHGCCEVFPPCCGLLWANNHRLLPAASCCLVCLDQP